MKQKKKKTFLKNKNTSETFLHKIKIMTIVNNCSSEKNMLIVLEN